MTCNIFWSLKVFSARVFWLGFSLASFLLRFWCSQYLWPRLQLSSASVAFLKNSASNSGFKHIDWIVFVHSASFLFRPIGIVLAYCCSYWEEHQLLVWGFNYLGAPTFIISLCKRTQFRSSKLTSSNVQFAVCFHQHVPTHRDSEFQFHIIFG